MSKKILSTLIGLLAISIYSTNSLAATADEQLKAPQHHPDLARSNSWVASTFDDSSSLHVPVTQYKLCFRYVGQEGTHDVYSVAIYGDSPWFQGSGIAHQEGDQVFIHADAFRGRKLTTQWELVAGPGLNFRDPMMGTGHWLEWSSYPSNSPSEFRNVRFDKKRYCYCTDKECTAAVFVDRLEEVQ